MRRIKFTRPGNNFEQLQSSSSWSTDVHCWVMTYFQIFMKLCGHHTLFLSVTYRKKRSARGAVTVPRPGVRSAASRARATAWCLRGARGRRAPRPASHPGTPDQRGPDGDISSPTPRRVSVVYIGINIHEMHKHERKVAHCVLSTCTLLAPCNVLTAINILTNTFIPQRGVRSEITFFQSLNSGSQATSKFLT